VRLLLAGEVDGGGPGEVGPFEDGGIELFELLFFAEVGGVEGAEGAHQVGDMTLAEDGGGEGTDGGKEGVNVGDVVVRGVLPEPAQQVNGEFVAAKGGAAEVVDGVVVFFDGDAEGPVEGGFVHIAVGVGGEDGDVGSGGGQCLGKAAYHLAGAAIDKGDGGDDLEDFEGLAHGWEGSMAGRVGDGWRSHFGLGPGSQVRRPFGASPGRCDWGKFCFPPDPHQPGRSAVLDLTKVHFGGVFVAIAPVSDR